MPIIQVAEYAPDQAPYLNGNLSVASGVYPREDGSDGPLRGPVVLTAALASACRGAFAARDKTATAYMVAGTAGKLYIQAGTAWTDKAGAAYAVPTGGHWRFTQFGELILATNYVDAVQTWTMGAAGNFADLAAGAPLAKYIATVEPGFVMLGFYSSGGVVANGVWWSGINDATSWPTIGTTAAASAQSDNQQLPGGGFVTGILPAIGGAAAAVFTERAVYRVEYVGAPAIFSFREVERGRGCICPQGLTQVGPLAFYISEDGFCMFDGTQVVPIGFGKVDKKFLGEVDVNNLERVYAAIDYARKCVIWAYPTNAATSGNPNRWMIYNYANQRWRYCDDASIVSEYFMPARLAGYNLDTLDSVLTGGPDASGGFTVDSALYIGGTRVLSAFDTSHRLVSYEGSTLAARVETGDADMSGSRIFVSGIRPLTDAASATARVGTREVLSDALVYTDATAPGVDGYAPQRVSTGYARAVVEVPASAEWTYLQGADVTARADGRR